MSWLRKLGRGLAKVAAPVAAAGRVASRVPGARAIPVVGTGIAALSAIDMGSRALSALSGGGSSGLPALPSGGGLPALPGTAMADPRVGMRSIFRDDPNIVAALQPFAIPARELRTYHRAPIKGFVIRYDSAGDPYAIPKTLARKYLGWKPSKKPPISVGEWESIKRADRASKKVKKAMTPVARVDKNIRGGKVVVPKRKKD